MLSFKRQEENGKMYLNCTHQHLSYLLDLMTVGSVKYGLNRDSLNQHDFV